MEPLVTGAHSAEVHRHLILLIEADFLTRWRAGEYLRETGFDVIEAVGAAEGLAAIRARSPIEAIFCDAGVFEGDVGADFLLCLENERPPFACVIASSESNGASMLKLNSTRLSIKPYVLDEIEQRLRALLAAHRP